MSNIAIKVEKLGKRYRIGAKNGEIKNIREAALDIVKAPIRNFRRLKGLTNFKDGNPGEANDIIWALKDVSFEVKQGEVVGIIGRNGAGKSTLLKILTRITEPTEGSAEIRGRVSSLLEVGTGFHPELTGRENVYLNGAILGMRKWEIDKKFDEIVAFAEVEKFLDTPVKRYSSGMKVRLAFAVAAHLEPEVLLVDEVLAVGDMAFQKKCLGKMDEVAKAGRTVLFVSHNMGAIQRLCSKGLLLENGKIAKNGSAEDCIDYYLRNGSECHKTILERAIIIDKSIEISSVTINGSFSDNLHVGPECKQLNLEIIGQIHRSMRLNIEARFFDLYDIPLAFFSPGHEKGYTEIYPLGQFRLTTSIELPQVARGEYYLYLYITDPGIAIWVEIPHAVRLNIEGFPTTVGSVFDYSRGSGWIFLQSKESVTTR